MLAELGKSAVFVVWGFEASFTTDLPSTGSGQMSYLGPSRFPADFGADRHRPRWGFCSPACSIPHVSPLGTSEEAGMAGPFRVSVPWLLTYPSVCGGRVAHLGKEAIYPAPPVHTGNLSRRPWGHLATLKGFIWGWGHRRRAKEVFYCDNLG